LSMFVESRLALQLNVSFKSFIIVDYESR